MALNLNTQNFNSSDTLDQMNQTLVNGGSHKDALQDLITTMGIQDDPKAQSLTVSTAGLGSVIDDGKGQEAVNSAAIASAQQAQSNNMGMDV